MPIPTTVTELGFPIATSNRWTSKPRPQPDHPDIVEQIADDFGRKLCNWANEPDRLEEHKAYVRETLLRSTETDGYALAKNMDNDGWLPDAELVEILNDLQSAKKRIYYNNLIQWASINQIKPSFNIGDRVECEIRIGKTTKRLPGIILLTSPNILEYFVHIPGAGHTPRQGITLQQEKLIALPEANATP